MSTTRIVREGENKSRAGFQEIGILTIGQKDATRGFPMSLDHFRVRGKNDTPCAYEKQFKDAFGDKPTVIPIVFFSDDDAINCVEQWEAYAGGNRLGSGDGHRFNVWDANAPHPTDKNKKGNYVDVVGKDNPLVKAIGASWKVRLTLRFIIPKIKGVIGSWTFKTGGEKTTIPSIVAAYDQIKAITGGVIKMIPFDLVLTKVKSSNPGEVKHYKTVSLVPSLSADKIDDLKGFISAGRNLAELGTFVMDESKLHQLAENPEVKQIEQKTQDVAHVELVHEEVAQEAPPAVEEKATEQEEKRGAMAPNPRAEEVNAEDIINKVNQEEQKPVTPSLKKGKGQAGLFGDGK